MISLFLNRLSWPQNGQLWRPCKTRAVERLGDKKSALIYKRLLNVRLCLQREAFRPAKAHKLVLPEKKIISNLKKMAVYSQSSTLKPGASHMSDTMIPFDEKVATGYRSSLCLLRPAHDHWVHTRGFSLLGENRIFLAIIGWTRIREKSVSQHAC